MQSRKKHKILIAFDDMIANVINNEKLNPIVIEIFIDKIKHFNYFYYATMI